ncbi:MAG: ACP phosphodiesterase [Parahaliea sp.]
MNFLAHFHLAWPDPGLVAGALEGDYYKGPLRGDLLSDIERGVRLHRAVDAYTDQHPRLASLREDFPAELRRYAGILIDLSFDHYLSRHWAHYHDDPLSTFSTAIYRQLASRRGELGSGARRMYQRLVDHDLLNAYHRWDMVTGSASQVGARLRRGNALANINAPLTALQPRLEAGFLDFYPDLLRFAGHYRQQLQQDTDTPPTASKVFAPRSKCH